VICKCNNCNSCSGRPSATLATLLTTHWCAQLTTLTTLNSTSILSFHSHSASCKSNSKICVMNPLKSFNGLLLALKSTSRLDAAIWTCTIDGHFIYGLSGGLLLCWMSLVTGNFRIVASLTSFLRLLAGFRGQKYAYDCKFSVFIKVFGSMSDFKRSATWLSSEFRICLADFFFNLNFLHVVILNVKSYRVCLFKHRWITSTRASLASSSSIGYWQTHVQIAS